jgi:hypothetical protein
VRVYDQGLDLSTPQNFGEYRLTYRNGDMIAPRVDAAEPLALELQDFHHAITTNTPPRSNTTLGLHIVQAIEAAQHSLRLEGKPVDVELAEDGGFGTGTRANGHHDDLTILAPGR